MEKISCGGFYLGDNLSIENVDGKEVLNSEGLPKVTASDNGKVLGVVDGAWGKTDAPSGGGSMVVTFTVDEDDVYSANKTVDEVLSAISSGLNVYGIEDIWYGMNLVYSLSTYDTSAKQVSFYAAAVGINPQAINMSNTDGVESVVKVFAGADEDDQGGD